MWEFYVLIILIIAFAFLVYPLITVASFFINISLFIIIAIRARIDLKDNKMQVYYLIAAFVTALLFVVREYGFLGIIFDFLFNQKILYYTQAVIILFILAHIIGLSHSYLKRFLKDLKKSKSSV